ncbi:hypothetical protein JCM16814_28750 [Desulfobaculum senezii]
MTFADFNPRLLGGHALLAIHFAVVLTGLGAFPLAVVSEYIAGAKKKVFLKKFAQQVSLMGVLFVFAALLSVFGSIAYLHYTGAQDIRPWLTTLRPITSANFGSLGVMALFATIYAFTWKGSRKVPGLHKLWGVLASLGALATLACPLSTQLMSMANRPLPGTAQELSTFLLSGMGSLFFAPLFLLTLTLAVAFAAAFGLVWMILRRGRDDWGRDYYSYASRYCAGWAAAASVAAAACTGWLFYTIQPTVAAASLGEMTRYFTMGGAGLAVLASLLWAVVLKAATPMRHKPTMVIAALCLLVAAMGMFETWAMTLLAATP